MPLLEMTRSVMIMISTPVNTFNFFSKLLTLKDDNGNPVFLSYSVELVCKRCLHTDHPEKCRHMIHMLPRWKDEDKMKTAELIMQDQETVTLLRESRGLVIDDDSSYFEGEEIEDMIKATPWSPREDERPRWVLVSIDPNTRNSKTSSNLALFAMTLEGRLFTVSNEKNGRHENVFDARHREKIFRGRAGAFQEADAPIVERVQPISIRLLVHHVFGDLILHVLEKGQEEQERQEERVGVAIFQRVVEYRDDDGIGARFALISISDDLGKPFEIVPVHPLEIDLDSIHVVPELVQISKIHHAIEYVPLRPV